MTKAQIIREVKEHVQKCGGSYLEWYCGVAADPRGRLFNDHNVSEKDGSWIYRACANSDEAREIEEHFLDAGMKGGSGGGGDDTTAVYAYKITSSTRE